MSESDWHSSETYKSLMQYGAATLKFVFTANGGSVVALLSYVAAVYGKGCSTPDLKWPMLVFVGGVFLGGCATVTAYLTQLSLFNESQGREGSHALPLKLTMGLAILGVLAFMAGSVWAVLKLSAHVAA